MKRGLCFRVVAILFAIASFISVRAMAQTVGAGPYYATPSWDQKLQCDTQATCPRFIVLSNWNSEAVLDRESGLVWERSPSTSNFNWQNAQLRCIGLNTGNRGGWHLPTVQELRSLVDPSRLDPALPAGHPFTNVQSAYWSATTSAANTDAAWGVEFDSAGDVNSLTKSNTLFAWCVRGGQGTDPQ